MKKLLLLAILFSLSLNLSAQEGKHIGPFKIKKIDVMVGIDSDRINNFDQSYFMNQINNSDFPFEQFNFDNVEHVTAICENPHFRFGLTLDIPNLDRLEWRNAINWMPNRIDQINYFEDYTVEHEDQFGNFVDYTHKSMSITQTQSEIALESSMLYTLVDNRVFKVYTGIGSNAGVTYNDHISVYGTGAAEMDDIVIDWNQNFSSELVQRPDIENSRTFYNYYNNNSGSQFNHRLFGQVGGSIIILKRVELGVDFRRGIGYRVIKDAPVTFTNLVSTGLSLRYILK